MQAEGQKYLFLEDFAQFMLDIMFIRKMAA
jgi:hypothetical protein